jgi:hypothetical protein
MDASIVSALVQAGSAGLVLITVIYFLKFIEARDKQWQEFFTKMNSQDNEVLRELRQTMTAVRDELICLRNDFERHDDRERGNERRKST